MPVSSGMNIRMFPLTLDGDGGTAAASERGWVCLGVGWWGCVCVAASGIDWSDFTSRLQTGCFQVKATGNVKCGTLSLVPHRVFLKMKMVKR